MILESGEVAEKWVSAAPGLQGLVVGRGLGWVGAGGAVWDGLGAGVGVRVKSEETDA